MTYILRAVSVVALAALSLGSATGADRTPTAVSTASFVRLAGLSDMFETKSSELAAIKGDEATRAFAAKMNEAHQKTSSELGMLVKGRAADLPLPSRLDPSRQRLIDQLSDLKGESFKRRYAEGQVRAHEDAIRLFSDYSSSSDEGPLQKWAITTLPKLKEHLEQSRSLLQSTSSGRRASQH